MNSLAAVCDVHGSFPSRAFAMFNVQSLTLSGNTESCPKCGRASKLVDGTFNVSPQGVVRVLSAPQWTREALRDVHRAIQSMSQHAVKDPDLQIRRLKKTNPQAAELLTVATDGWTREQKIQLWSVLIAFLSAVLGAVSLYQSSTREDLSPSEIAGIVNEAVKQAQEDSLDVGPEVPGIPQPDKK